MSENRSTKYTYKGILLVPVPKDKDEGDITLGVFHSEQMYFISISDHDKIYTNIKLDEIGVCVVEFQDGTEPVDFLIAQERDFKDIFIQIHYLAVFTIDPDGDRTKYAYTTMLDNPLYWIPNVVHYVNELFFDPEIVEQVELYKDWNGDWASSGK